MLTIKQNKKSWGTTSERILLRITQEILPAYNQPGPFNMPPLEPNMYKIRRDVQKICKEEEKRSRKGFTISSNFCVDLVNNEVKVMHVKNENEDEVFFTLIKT